MKSRILGKDLEVSPVGLGCMGFSHAYGTATDEKTAVKAIQQAAELKYAVDHAIQDGRMKPMILVCPTYNNTGVKDSWDYSLALQLTDQFHNELLNDLIPAVESKYHTWADFDASPANLKATRDHRGFGGFSYQINSMVNDYSDTFHLANNEVDGNVSYRIYEGGTHGPEASNQYTFNALLWFWNN